MLSRQTPEKRTQTYRANIKKLSLVRKNLLFKYLPDTSGKFQPASTAIVIDKYQSLCASVLDSAPSKIFSIQDVARKLRAFYANNKYKINKRKIREIRKKEKEKIKKKKKKKKEKKKEKEIPVEINSAQYIPGF